MEERYIDPLKDLRYAELKEKQEKRMREFEKEFNNEFGTEFYFMVMERDKKQ